MSAPRLVVVGSSNTDMVVSGERLPAPGETVLGGRFLMNAGGKGANQAVAAARLGARVTLVARLGRDPFGDAALGGFAAESIDTRFVGRDREAPSGVALILVDRAGENLIAVAPGANERLRPRHVDAAAAAIRAADLLLLQLEVPLDTVRHAAELAAAAGVPVLLDPAPARPLDDELLGRIDVLTPNETEARQLSDGAETARRAAERLRQRGVRRVVVTLGPAGSLLVDSGGVVQVPARPVEAVDTTAAGDAFNGALAVALAEGSDLPAAAGFATRVAALSVARHGAQASLPTRRELDASEA